MTDYFQDILPPDDAESPAHRIGRSIRNISMPPSRGNSGDAREHARRGAPGRGVRFSGVLPWMLAGGAVIVVSVLGLFVFRKTTITVAPRTHDVVLDSLPVFTAYPAPTAATGTLRYTVREFDLEESASVKAQGVRHIDRKASGAVVVLNAYSPAPVKLVANTRFATAEGLIFRAPAAVVIPGKKGTKPGSVSVTIVADAPGAAYNIAPGAFSLPGLKSGPMYAGVRATSRAVFSGGFSGDEPATDPSALAAATAEMRGRIERKIRDTLSSSKDTIAFPDIATIVYTDLPSTPESDDSVRLHERAHVTVPVFDAQELTAAIAGQAIADPQGADIRLVAETGFSARTADFAAAPAAAKLGAEPISFNLTGKTRLVWQIDDAALAKTLAGRDAGAFETVVKGFPSIQEAKARIEPFWSRTFPADSGKIRVVIVAPATH